MYTLQTASVEASAIRMLWYLHISIYDGHESNRAIFGVRSREGAESPDKTRFEQSSTDSFRFSR
jgi:hypothetical protein